MKTAVPALLLLSLLLFSPVLLWSDAVRGSVVEILEIESGGSAEGSFHLEELCALNLGDGAPFFTGIELKLTVPGELARMRNSFAVYLYRRVSPEPETNTTKRYFGESLDYYVVPAGRTMYLQIPLRASASLPNTPETVRVPTITGAGDYPLLLTVLPIMKGIPSDIYDATFTLEVYPYVADEGILDLTVEAPDDRPFTLTIDGAAREYREDGYVLPGGVHEISVESEAYLPLKRTVNVARGERTEASLILQKREPRVNFETPEGTVIFLDGERVNGTSLKVDEGTHTVVFKLGDYSMTREFEVTGGKSYTITLFFDIYVKEN